MVGTRRHWAAAAALIGSAAQSFGQPPVAPPTPPQPSAVDRLVKQGEDAFASGNLDQARDAFTTAVAVDPKSTTAARDLGIVLLRQDQPAKAAKPLQVAASTKSPDRALVLALVSEHVATKTPMQGVKPLLAYVGAHPAAADEPLVNALGIALAQADVLNIKGALYADAKRSYEKLNSKLEVARPGEKRWGVEWVPATEVDAKRAAAAAAQVTMTQDAASIRDLTADIARLTQQRDAIPHSLGDNNLTQQQAALQKQIDGLDTKRDAAQKVLYAAKGTAAENQPRWPDNIPVDSLTLAADEAQPAAAGR